MMDEQTRLARQRLFLAFDLFDAGVDMMRQNLKRRFPDLEPAAIQAQVDAWLLKREGAPYGDAEGRPGFIDRFQETTP